MTANGATINDRPESKYKDKEYVRVTEAIQMVAKKIWDRGRWVSPLDQWAINTFQSYKEYEEYMRQAAERGSLVDEAIKNLLKGQNLPQDVREPIKGYLDAFDKFLSTWSLIDVQSDLEVSDEELKLVGTLDIFGTIKNGLTYPNAVLDIKTGSPGFYQGKKTYPIYDEMHWQTAAYRKMKGAESNWILRLFDDGEFRIEADQHYDRSIQFITLGAHIAHLKKQC